VERGVSLAIIIAVGKQSLGTKNETICEKYYVKKIDSCDMMMFETKLQY